MIAIFTGWNDVVDGAETVTITLKHRDGDTVLANVSGVLRRALNKNDAMFLGFAVQGNEVVFNVPTAELAANEIERGDVITDANSNQYNVQSAAQLSGGTRWRCVCQKAAQ